jgi:hypothetical protein
MTPSVANREQVERVEDAVDQGEFAETATLITGDTRDPLDIPYSESGLPRPILYNPIRPGGTYYAHTRDEKGRWVTAGKIKVWAGQYRFETPRQAQWAQDHMRKMLKGNEPSRWIGNNLDPEDKDVCECGFTTLNSKVAIDHRRYWKHQSRID